MEGECEECTSPAGFNCTDCGKTICEGCKWTLHLNHMVIVKVAPMNPLIEEHNHHCHCSALATYFCDCMGNWAYYCDEHLEEHETKGAYREHSIVSMNSFNLVSRLGMAEFKKRSSVIDYIQEEFPKQIRHAEALRAKIEEECNRRIDREKKNKDANLRKADEALGRARRLFSDFESHVPTLRSKNEPPKNTLEEYVTENQDQPSLTFIRFNIKENYIQTNNKLFMPKDLPFMPIVKNRVLLMVPIPVIYPKYEVTALRSNVDKGCGFCLSQEGDIYITGGYQSSNVWILQKIAIAKDLPSMREKREHHGSIHYKGHLYAFGGEFRDGKLKTAECFDTERRGKWESLGNMSTHRRYLTPCLFENRILLIGGNELSCEEYSIGLKRFRDLPLRLPFRSATIAFPIGQQLIFFCDHLVMTVRNIDKDLEPRKVRELEHGGIQTNVTPFYSNGCWYFSDITEKQIIEFAVQDSEVRYLGSNPTS